MSATSGESGRCTKEGPSVRLPVVQRRGSVIARSRNSRRRFTVLVVVQVLMIAHLVLWLVSRRTGWWDGRTLSPVEPSESMEFVKNGVVNAGLVFFAAALLATLVLGRWFCGWGCHLVLLQDACAALMRRLGVRPKPFRSRLLIYVPLVLALYMWVWPAAYRWVWVPLDARLEQSLGAEHWLVEGPRTVAGWLRIPLGPAPPPWRVQNHLVTDDFWRSFAGPAVAAPFLLICGFATVYFLGAKGFCTYGCPYGGFFAPFDRLAAGRIRVNDDCEQCGHCTAVCSSNVRVHEEVHAWGMVVDPGCMKCLDCVSVCPNDALSFGFGRPSLRRGAARAPRPRRRYDLTLAEDVGFTLVFVASFFAVRGVYGLVPLLMAAGTAGCVTFLAWKLWRMLRDANVSFHRWRLKYRDATTVPGHVFTSITVVCLMLVAHSGAIRIMQAVAERHDDRVTMARATVLSPRPEAMPPEMARHADAAIRWYRRASGFRDGGLGLFTHRGTDVRLAWLHACRQEHEAATRHLRRAIARTGGTEARHRDLVDLLRLQGLPNEALAHQHAVVEAEPSYVALMDHLVEQYVVNERHDDALALARRGLDRAPRDRALPLLRRVAMLLVTADRDDEALAAVRGWLEAAPPEPFGLSVLSETQAATGDIAAAIETMELAIEMAPRAIGLRLQLAFLLDAVGRTDEAAAQRDEADRLRRK